MLLPSTGCTVVVVGNQRDTQLLKGVLPIVLLALLTEENYGYAIVEKLQTSGFPELLEGTVYPALSRLESNGLLTSRLARSGSGPARKYYSLSSQGEKTLTERSGVWDELVSNVNTILNNANGGE